MNIIEQLYASLDQRKRPEDIADLILQLEDLKLGGSEQITLKVAAQRSLRLGAWNYTSMSEDFFSPTGAKQQVEKANDLFATAYRLSPQDCEDPKVLEAFIRHLSAEIKKPFGANDYKRERLNKEQREELGLDISRRKYNKLFRHLIHLEEKLESILKEQEKRRLTQIGKSGLAYMLTPDEFGSDIQTAAFIAYFTARNNLRSEFTIFGQQSPFDNIAHMLFKKCESSHTTNWWAIAHVFPKPEVLQQLSETQRGQLLGYWFSILQESSEILENVWHQSDINRETMVVQRGNDSSTWNNTANTWNKARDNWIALLYAMGMESMLDSICFGKVLRLMAADVVAWHLSSGGQLDPDTKVWRDLPLPWEVISGEETCTKADIESICQKHGVHPEKKAWTLARPYKKVVEFRPTPELVHGVSISNPHLAKILRSAKFFSGKS